MKPFRPVMITAAAFLLTITSSLRATTNIDIMILYDQAARQYVSDNHANSLLAFANQMVGYLNQSMSNSTVDVQYRLVHFGSVATNFLGDTTNALANAPALGASGRTLHGADLVTLMTDGVDPNSNSGVGNLPATPAGDATQAFTAQIIEQSDVYRTMTHEVGHNMGSHHSLYQRIQPGPGVFPYSSCWYFRGTNGHDYCTVMAYPDDGYGYQYENILTDPWMFSNPNLRYMGVPIGDTNLGDNVRSLTNMVPIIAAYRTEPANIPPSVEIVYPMEGSTNGSPGTEPWIPVTAEVMDPDGTITAVVFYANDVQLAFSSNSVSGQANLFTNKVANSVTGTNKLEVVAWDNSGSAWTSMPVYVLVETNKYPIFSGAGIIQPPGTLTIAPATGWTQHGRLVNLYPTVTDPDGSITSVVYFANGSIIGIATNNPFNFTWTCTNLPVAPATETSNDVVAVAYDDQGASSESATNTIFIGPDIPPFVEILSPSNGASLWNTNVLIIAAANHYDIDDTITQVVFYVNGTNVGNDTTLPYSATWTATGMGSNIITAVAWGGDGECATSRTSTLIIGPNQAPVISITSPTNGALLPGQMVSIQANASDPDDTVQYVQFLANSNLISTITNFPYWTAFQGTGGVYSLIAVAVDELGLATTSTAVSVTSGTNQGPTVTITSPTNGAQIAVTVSSVTLSCTAVDPDGTVTSVVFYLDGVQVGSRINPPYNMTIQPPGMGNHVTTVAAWDDSGNCRFASTTWTVPTRPDIEVSSLTLIPANVSTGSLFGLKVVIKNTGSTASNIHVSVWENNPAAVTNDTGETAGADVTSLGVGESASLTFTNLSAGISTNARTLRVFAESRLTVDEENESNNQSSLVYTPITSDTYNYIDVMVLYDLSARSWLVDNHGGSYLANANLVISELNQSVLNSGISNVTYRLGHFGVLETNFTTSVTLTNIWIQLKSATNQELAVLQPWQRDVGADVVAFVLNATDTDMQSGISEIPGAAGNRTNCYSISMIANTEIDDTFTHNIGHNMGCGHSKFQGLPGWNLWAWPPGPGAFSYAAGWYFQGTNSQNYRTICATDNDGAGYIYNITTPRMFSTPNLSYLGTPIGDPEHGNNVRCLTNMIPVVSTNMAPPADIPPSVEITLPAYGAFIPSVSGVDTFPLYAEATDLDGSVVQVEFRNMGRQKDKRFYFPITVNHSVSTNSPNLYMCDMLQVVTGTNWLYAVATDDGGNSWTSALSYVEVELGCGPSLQLVYNPPTNSMTFTTSEGPGWSQHGWLATNFTALASDNNGWVDYVDFYANNSWIGRSWNTMQTNNSTPTPFTIQWRMPNPPPAPQSVTNFITAVAHDNDGAVSGPPWTTNVVVMVPNIPPYVAIHSPTNGAMQWTNVITFITTAHAYDIDDSITQMVFYVNGTAVGIFTQKMDSFAWTAPSNGIYTLKAAVWDEDNAFKTSFPSVVTIGPNQAPSITITSPTNGTVFPGQMISIQATASDPEDNLEYVQFLANGSLIGTVTNIPFWISWPSTGGVYSLEAVAVDDLGLATTSAAVSVTTGANQAPSVTITSPTNNAQISVTATSVTLSCTATDSDGVVTSVVFYLNGSLVGSMTNAPYSITIPSPGSGDHTTTVAAWDDSGNCRFASALWHIGTLPDLTISRIIFNPVNVITGTTFDVNVIIRNLGSTTSNFHVSVWTNMPAVATNDSGETAGLDVFSTITNGQSVTLTFTNLSAGTSSVARILRAFVDSRFSVDELNEANNQKKLSYTPSGAPAYENVDVMMLYDRAALSWIATNQGGSFIANANLEIAKLNQAMTNSTVPVRYRLVHFGAVATNFAGDLNASLDVVEQLTNGLPQIPSWRTRTGADIITLMTDGVDPNGAAGLSEMPNNPAGDINTSFNANIISSAALDMTMTHEIGHNMGCGHGKYQQLQPGPGVFSYSAGWYFRGTDGNDYATIMSYTDDGYGFLFRLTSPPIFSSPDLRYKGVPVGDVAHANNVRSLTNMFPVIAAYVQEPEDIPPSVEIVMPKTGDNFASTANCPFITIRAETMDPDGTITAVVFYANGLELGSTSNSVPNSPNVYSNAIPNLQDGTNQLYTVAWDNSGNCWTSAPVEIIVASNAYPQITLVTPLDGAAQHGWMVTNITATATDPDGVITAVVFYTTDAYINGDPPIAIVTNSPYTTSWLCPAIPGWSPVNYSIIAQAWDNEGASTLTRPNSITFGPDLPPFVEILSPTNGASTWRTNITIQAALNQYDIDDVITQIVFYVNGTNVGIDTTSPYSATWTATGIGTNTITAVAWASDNQCSTSRPSTFTIATNHAPVIAITSPLNGTVLTGRGISIMATATDPDGDPLSPVQFQVNGVTVITATNYPYWVTWLSPTSGVYNISAVVTDEPGFTTTSTAVTVTSGTNLPPTVKITSPTNNAVISLTSSIITLSCTATDPQGVVTSVVFYVNGALVGRKTIAPYAVYPLNPGAGTNITTVAAWDNSGNVRFESSKWIVRDIRPDFQVTAIQLIPSTPVVGTTFSAKVTITNTGETAGDPRTLSIWTNAPTEQVWGLYSTKSGLPGIVPAHGSKVFTFTGLSAGAAESTGRTFRAFVNSARLPMEITTSNNQTTVLYDVKKKSDLTITALTFTPTSLSRGGLFNANVTVKNQGTTNSPDAWLSVWLNKATAPTNNALESAGLWIGTLATNKTRLITFTNLPVSTGTLAQKFYAFADSTNGIDELSEINNQKYLAYTPVSRPDFVIFGIALSTTNPVINSTNLSANVTVKNVGYLSGNAGYVDVWADKITNVVPSLTLRGDKYQLAGTVAVNATKILTFTGLTVTNVISTSFRAVVDSRAATVEIVETNNQDTVDYTPVP